MFIEKYPYTNFHELNLDFLLTKIRELETEISEFVARNSIKYADPFQWNITTQYGKNTVTIDANTGVAYLSIQPVPSGISITNTDYWTPVFDLGQMFMSFNDNLTEHDEGQNITSSASYAVDDWIIWNNLLYVVTTPISIGDGFVPGLNIEQKSVEDLFKAFITTVNAALIAFINTVNENLSQHDEGQNITSSANYAVNDWIIWNNLLYVVTAPISVGDSFVPGTNIEQKSVEDLFKAFITTVNDALDAFDDDITTIQGDIITIQSDINNISGQWLDGKKIYVFGDSLSYPKTDGLWENVKKLVPTCTIQNEAENGYDMSQIANKIANTDITDADVVFILGGTNNWQGGSTLDQFYTMTAAAITNVYSQNNTCKVVMMVPPFSWSGNFPATIVPYLKNKAYAGISDYGNIIKLIANQNHIPVIDLFNYSNIGPYNYTTMMEDSGSGGISIYVHPLAKANEYIAGLVVNQVYNNKYDPFVGTLAKYWDSTGINVNDGAEVDFDPNNGCLTMSAVVSTDAAVSTPSGYTLQFNFPYGSWIMFNGRHDDYRFMISKYSDGTVKIARVVFNSSQYMGAIIVENGPDVSSVYLFSH